MVIDLQVLPGTVTALVSGSDIYEIAVRIKPMPEPRWKAVVKACAGKIDSVVELLAGRFDESVMAHVCRQGTGLFPAPAEITYECSCPDGARGDGSASTSPPRSTASAYASTRTRSSCSGCAASPTPTSSPAPPPA